MCRLISANADYVTKITFMKDRTPDKIELQVQKVSIDGGRSLLLFSETDTTDSPQTPSEEASEASSRPDGV